MNTKGVSKFIVAPFIRMTFAAMMISALLFSSNPTSAQSSCIPSPISPQPDAVLDNGRIDRDDYIVWDFDWSDCPGATQYHLYVFHIGSQFPVIDRFISSSSYHYECQGCYITEQNRVNWTWKVRAYVNNQWGAWSETRIFSVEPVNTDPPYIPPPPHPCIPPLISPQPDAVLDNGRTDGNNSIVWDFDWSDCTGATRYNLYVFQQFSYIDNLFISSSAYHYECQGCYITEPNRFGWAWKVRAYVNNQWGAWSETRTFSVEPIDTDLPPASLIINYSNGKPGSFFSLTGSNFPPNGTAMVTLNGYTLTNSLVVNSSGGFTFRLDTSQADSGSYFITTAVNPSATTSFRLDPTAPLRPPEGSGPTLNVPSGIAFTQFAYLPLIQR